MKRTYRALASLLCVIGLSSAVILTVGNSVSRADTRPDWMGNTIGISDAPPPPFTPMGGSEKEIRCWGRNYTVGALGLPSQISNSGKDVLAGPVELRITMNGQVVPWQKVMTKLVKQEQVDIRLLGTAESSIGRIESAVTAEYDGMIRYDFTLRPDPGVTLDKMELVFPLKSEQASLFYLAPGARGRLTSIVTGWWNYWWIGNEERGLTAFCETEEACDHAGRRDSFQVRPLPDGHTVEVAWSFASQPWKLPSPWRFTFGLQATPVKPLPADWRLLRAQAPGMNVQVPWPNPSDQLYFTPPEPRDVTAYRKLAEDAHANGLKFIPYSQLTWISSATPEWQKYQSEWVRPDNEKNDSSGDVAAFKVPVMCVRPTQSWIDFCVWNNQRLLRELDLDGIYVDFAMTQFWEETRGGQRMRYWPFFAVREVFKRTYTMLKEDSPGNILIAHMSPHMETPILAFTDVYLDGEGNWVGQLKDNYLDIVPLDAFRAEFMGRQYGIIPWFLPQWYGAQLEDKDVASRQKNGQPDQVTVEKSQHLFGLGLLHDFSFWPICGMNVDATKQYYGVLDKFGIADAEFFGYWNNSALIGGQTEEIKASAYRKPEGGALIVVYNTTREPKTADLTVAWARLKSKGPLSVIDAYTEKPIGWRVKSVTIEVPPINHRLLWVK